MVTLTKVVENLTNIIILQRILQMLKKNQKTNNTWNVFMKTQERIKLHKTRTEEWQKKRRKRRELKVSL